MDSMDMSLSELREMVMNREAWCAVIHGVARVGHNWATELNWTDVVVVWNSFPKVLKYSKEKSDIL